MREAKPFDLFLLILLGLIWGSSFFNIKIATYTYEPFTLALVRVFFACLPLVCLCFFKKIKILGFSKNWKPYAVIGLCNIVIPFILIAVGTSKIDSYLAAVLMSTTPLSGSILAQQWASAESAPAHRLETHDHRTMPRQQCRRPVCDRTIAAQSWHPAFPIH